MLEEHKGHLEGRWQQYTSSKKAIEDAEGSLASFAQARQGRP
jgi:hypothetical protein